LEQATMVAQLFAVCVDEITTRIERLCRNNPKNEV
jgi:hypothetical protein